MQQQAMTLLEWQEAFSTEEKCLNHLVHLRWPEGFVCDQCGHGQAWFTSGHKVYECKSCHHRTSAIAGTLFHSTKLPLVKWFVAIYFVAVEKGGISAERLRQYINVNWNTARYMLTRLRHAMAHREEGYLLQGVIEIDEAFVGGKATGGKRGRGAERKTSVIVAVEQGPEGKRAGYLKMKALPQIDGQAVQTFSKEAIQPEQHLKMDGSPMLKTLVSQHHVESKVTAPQDAPKWLPWVHIAIANLKRFLLGTFHGVSPTHLQEYLDEFCFRFNRRFWLLQIPDRLLLASLRTPPPKALRLS